MDPDQPFFVYSQRAPRSIDWLYPGLIPIGKVTLLIGDPGIGKSLQLGEEGHLDYINSLLTCPEWMNER